MKLNLARGFSVPASLVLGKNKQGGNDEEAFVRSSKRALTLFEKCLGQSLLLQKWRLWKVSRIDWPNYMSATF
jgi:hypothetical protein